jgi:uncharacterized membrane protein
LCAAIIKVVIIISSVISHTRVRTKNKTPKRKTNTQISAVGNLVVDNVVVVPFICIVVNGSVVGIVVVGSVVGFVVVDSVVNFVVVDCVVGSVVGFVVVDSVVVVCSVVGFVVVGSVVGIVVVDSVVSLEQSYVI